MILSRNFVKDYIDIDITTKNLADKMVKIGNEYEKVSKLVNATNLVIGKVVECEKHPKSDHLHICKVDIGSSIINIVCGAPNVRKDLKVIVALENAVLPQMTIKKTKILDVESNGMLCSLAELGIDNKYLTEEDVKSIKELNEDAVVGEDPIKYLELDDEIIDFELTSNRADLLSILGFAYEIGAITDKKVKELEINYKENNVDITNELKLNVNTDNCYTFLVKKVNNIQIKESPLFIKNRLIACGIRPINNVVDISNYIMLETGQPLHFYDADKLGSVIGVRNATNNETLITLDNQKRILSSDDIVIINSENMPIGMAGVMGGLSTEIGNNTKNVVIESAIFNPYNIRYTSIKHLRSEASIRFEKGLDINRTYMAVERACDLLEKYASGSVCKGILEYNTLSKDDKVIDISISKINNVLGINISKEEIINIFHLLSFKVKEEKEFLKVYIPRRRVDISIEEDLIEEIGRIYGVDNINSTLPIFESKNPINDNKIRLIKDKLSSLGLSEVITYSLVNEKDVLKFTDNEFGIVKVKDPMSEERVALRKSLLTSLMQVYEYNKSRNNKNISIFEIGACFGIFEGEYIEQNKLSILMHGDFNLGINNEKVDFYILKGIIESLLDYLGYASRYSFVNVNMIAEMHPLKSAYINVNGKNIGFLGQIHPSNHKDEIYLCEINLNSLFEFKTSKIKYKEFSKYPAVNKDLAFILEKHINNEDVIKTIKASGGKLLRSVNVFDYYEGDKIDENKKSIAYSLVFECFENTLSDEEITPVFNKIIENVVTRHKAILRDK